jgi:hypothetical protein
MTGDRGDQGSPPGDEGPYRGVLGRTRTESVQVWMPDGAVRAQSVVVGVDAADDPELAARARAGILHRLGEGVELAIPYVYHDPGMRVFVLVVPETLRHRALALRAEHMALVAADADHAVPGYVRELELVVGHAGLGARLEARAGVSIAAPADNGTERVRALFERERDLARRERLMAARERSASPLAGEDSDELYASDSLGYGSTSLDEDELGEEAVDDELEEVEDLEDDAVLSADEASEVDEDEGDSEMVARALIIDDRDVLDVADSLTAPDWFAADDSSALCLLLSNGRVWLFARSLDAYAGGDIDLLLQLSEQASVPVVVVSLVCGSDTQGEVLRSVLDLDDPEQRAALLALGEHFEVEIMALVESDRFEHFATLTAARERNVRAIVEHLEREPDHDRDVLEDARRDALDHPPPIDDPSHPFRDAEVREPPRTATEAAVMLDELSEWLSPERRRFLLVTLCVPDEIIDACCRDAIAFALDWGLALPQHVAARALELGLEKDEAGLLTRGIEGLCRASTEPEYGGLEESVLRAMWSLALEQAARLGVSLPARARGMAQQHAGERALVHAAALSDSHDAALEPLRARALHGAAPDLEAMHELTLRGAYPDLLALCRATNQLEAEVAARVFVQVARRHDPVALDALLSLVSMAEAPQVRLGAALALASRRAVAAIDELAGHVAHEQGFEWRVFALALGRYGAGSFRAITRALVREGTDDERAAEVHAHLALHGARAQVRAKARSHEEHEASVAKRALERASELRDGKIAALGLEQQGPLTVFCEMFDRYFRESAS